MTSGRISIREAIAAGGMVLALFVVGYALRQTHAPAMEKLMNPMHPTVPGAPA